MGRVEYVHHPQGTIFINSILACVFGHTRQVLVAESRFGGSTSTVWIIQMVWKPILSLTCGASGRVGFTCCT